MCRRIGYVEFRSIDLVDKAIALSGTIVMGLPIQIQHTEAERNRLHAGDTCVPPLLLRVKLTAALKYESPAGG